MTQKSVVAFVVWGVLGGGGGCFLAEKEVGVVGDGGQWWL